MTAIFTPGYAAAEQFTAGKAPGGCLRPVRNAQPHHHRHRHIVAEPVDRLLDDASVSLGRSPSSGKPC